MTTKTNNEWEKRLRNLWFRNYGQTGHFLNLLIPFISNLLSSERQRIKEEMELAIAEEINIARQENQSTSRLTSLMMKMYKLLE